MVCPGCGGEFRPEVYVCPDCDLALEADPAEGFSVGKPPNPKLELTTVLETSDYSAVPVIESLLEAAGIPFVIRSKHSLGMRPGGGFFATATRELGSAIEVPIDRAEEARALLEAPVDANEAPPAFELLTRESCHLCDEMKQVLDRVLPEFGLGYSEVDIDEAAPRDGEDLAVRFGDCVPVLLRDGKPVVKVRLDGEQLRRIVRRRR